LKTRKKRVVVLSGSVKWTGGEGQGGGEGGKTIPPGLFKLKKRTRASSLKKDAEDRWNKVSDGKGGSLEIALV